MLIKNWTNYGEPNEKANDGDDDKDDDTLFSIFLAHT